MTAFSPGSTGASCSLAADLTLTSELTVWLGERRVELHYIGTPAHTVGGNHAKLTGYSEIALDQRWVEGLSRDENEVFRRVAGAINRRYGYDD